MASAGANPEWTRPDQRLPGRAPGGVTTWHRLHLAVGVFLVAYGTASLVSALVLWDDRRDEVGGYFGAGPAGTLLVLVKAAEAVLVALAVAGIVRRRDMWFVPPLAGWMAGFAMFAVLDVFKGRWGGLAEHLAYLAGFVVLLFVSYGLSAKAQVGSGAVRRSAPGSASGEGSGEGDGQEPPRLTRTQELALAALNRIPHR